MLLGQELKFKNKLCNLKLGTFFSALPGLGASALSGRTVYIGASVLSGRAAIRPRKFQLYEFCVKFIKKMHGNVCYCKYFVTFALDYENYELMIE